MHEARGDFDRAITDYNQAISLSSGVDVGSDHRCATTDLQVGRNRILASTAIYVLLNLGVRYRHASQPSGNKCLNANEALPQTDEACGGCGSDRRFMTSFGRTKLR